MTKRAPVSHPIHEILQNRWSPRAFSETPIEKEKILSLFEAARWAASALNEQPWRFIYATRNNSEDFEKLLTCLTEGNRVWCKSVPMLILTVIKTTFKNGNNNSKAEHDLGLATGNLTFEAMSAGLYVHIMGGIVPQNAEKIFNIPENYKPFTMIAVGYPGDPEQLPEDLKLREVSPRQRKALDDIAFEGEFRSDSL